MSPVWSCQNPCHHVTSFSFGVKMTAGSPAWDLDFSAAHSALFHQFIQLLEHCQAPGTYLCTRLPFRFCFWFPSPHHITFQHSSLVVSISAVLTSTPSPGSLFNCRVHAAKLLQSYPTLCDPIDCTHQVPLSMGFSKEEYWSGLPFLLQGIFPTQGWNAGLLHWHADSLPLTPPDRVVCP